jgi:signal transduction histidine kinase
MGEMIGNIAHQWRQPLTHLSYNIMNIQDAFKHNSLDEVYLNKKVDEATEQIEFMSQTIDDFKDFYAISKEKENFFLVEETKNALTIMLPALKQQDIGIMFVIKENLEIKNYKNEYKQVILNLLSNAKDVLVSRIILNPKIIITVENTQVTIADNGGGIESNVINKIFEPYFTTKEGNSGIGLYMSKMIVEKNMGGRLTVINGKEGAEFTMLFSNH